MHDEGIVRESISAIYMIDLYFELSYVITL